MDDETTLYAAKHAAGVRLTAVEAEVLLDHYRETIARIRAVLKDMGGTL